MGKIVTIEFEDQHSADLLLTTLGQDLYKNAWHIKAIEQDWHTPHELYQHRYHLYHALVFSSPYRLRAWRSRLHQDGTMFEDSFIVGINLISWDITKRNDITYHLPNSWWENFEGITTYDKAPEYDGASPAEGLRRLEEFVEKTKHPTR